ncbi:autotransporter assembly complex family protein [Photobacterium damselae subsp. piscicida]|nr:autotransporter assembly complex family protein [Photobacterium damselae subsp. piscicida]
MKKFFKPLSLTAFALAFSTAAHASSSLKIKGLDGKLESNVEAYLSGIPKEDYSATLRFQEQVEDEVKQALQALGYYQPSIDYRAKPDGDEIDITITVDAGTATHIAKSDIEITGAAANDPDFLALIRNSGLSIGNQLNHGNYEAFKSSLSSLALKKGYFDAEMTKSVMEVAPSRAEAFIIIHFDSGKRYNFGQTLFQGSQIDQDCLDSLIPYQENEPYLASTLGLFNERLSSVGWFSSIFVGGDVNERKGDEIPIHVALSPAVRNKVEVGMGYSTDVGYNFKLNWKKPWINSKGHSLTVKSEFSKVQPKIEAAYRIPLDDVLNNYYQVIGGIRYVDNHDTRSTEYSAGLERHWKLESGWKRIASLRWLYEDYKQGEFESGVAHMLIPGLTYTRTRTRGGAMPTWGDRQMFSVEVTDPALGSDNRLARLRGQTAWIRSLSENQRGLFRLDAGAVFTNHLATVPPSMRFFAGGDNSIRGYGYESVGPRDSAGKLLGGKYMATSSLEYQYRVYGDWWGAIFYDYGSAWNDSPDWVSGAGVGVRWASPVGPVTLDFAWGLDKEKDKFQLHFSLGPEL